MKYYKYICLMAIFIFNYLISQNIEDGLMVIKTNSYDSYIGYIIDEQQDSLIIKTYSGQNISIANNDVYASYPFAGRINNGKLQKKDPNSSFYIFSPSAFSIKDGNLYCRDFCLFYPSLNYGLTDFASLQAGLFWYPGLDYEDTPYVANLKISILETKYFAIAAGITYVNLPAIQKEKIKSTGFGFATGTIGNRYNHLSLSAGWGYFQKETEWINESKPILVAASNVRLLNSVSFVTENWFFPDEDIEDALITTAVRIFGGQIALDLGITFSVNSLDENENPIPVINITYHLR